MTWTEIAEQLDDTTGLGRRAAQCQAAAWSAGLDPAATRGLTGAALALGAAPGDLMGQVAPWRTDRAMLAAADDLAADVARQLRRVQQTRQAVSADLQAARAELARASAARPPDLAAITAARRRIADCETALEILGQVALRLGYARTRLAEIPGDLAETYQAANRHVQAGGILPYEGRWLTGTGPRR